MVDTEGPLFGEYRVDGVIDMTGGGEIIAQRLFKANADIVARQPCAVQALNRCFKK